MNKWMKGKEKKNRSLKCLYLNVETYLLIYLFLTPYFVNTRLYKLLVWELRILKKNITLYKNNNII